MSAKEIKSALKAAREAIKTKEYKTVIERCHEVLEMDKSNYMALIFLGAAHQDTSKSEAAKFLRRALAINPPDPLLAYQGLAVCTEKEELFDVCRNLLKLTPEKWQELYAKILLLADDLNDVRPLVEFILDELNEANEAKRGEYLNQMLVRILVDRPKLQTDFSDAYLAALERTIDDNTLPKHPDRWRHYLQLLCEKNACLKAAEEAKKMAEIYQNDPYPLELIVNIFVKEAGGEALRGNLSGFPIDLNWCSMRLSALRPKTEIALFARAIVLWLERKPILEPEVQKILESRKDKIAARILFDTHMRTRAYALAERVYRDAKLSGQEIDLIKSLIGLEKVEEAIVKCKEALLSSTAEPESQATILELLTKALILNGQKLSAEKSIAKLESMHIDPVKIGLLRCLLEEGISISEDLHLFDSDDLVEAGKLVLQHEQPTKALQLFFEAAKYDSCNSVAFFLLGKVYLTLKDEARAQKCFLKTLSLNPANKDALPLLSSIYRRQQKWEDNAQLLKTVAHFTDNEKNISFQIGLNNLAAKNYDGAVEAFRRAMRHDPDDAQICECLADAYFSRGSYKSAQKVYAKVVDLEQDNLYAKVQIGIVNIVLQEFQNAVEIFDDVLNEKPDYLPALKGRADVHYRMARIHMGQRLFGRSRENLQSSFHYLTKLISVQAGLSYSWKLLAKVLETAAELPETRAYLHVPLGFRDLSGCELLKGENLLTLSSTCISRALHINKDDPCLWFDLSNMYYKQSLRAASHPSESDLLKLAQSAAKHAIHLNSRQWQSWNLLGVISLMKEAYNPALSQHCFVQAITLEKKLPVAWSNLGILYLREGNIRLANKAFAKAQQADTTYLNAWIGQAIIAETIGDTYETVDLFRHCTELGFHREAAIGYANAICGLLAGDQYEKDRRFSYIVNHMHAASISLDQIHWYIEWEGQYVTPEALSFFGHLSIANELFRQGIEAFQRCVALLEDKSRRNEALCDLGYALLSCNEAARAVQVFQKISEASLKSAIGMALADFRTKQYQESYSAFESALEWLANTPEEKSFILVAMAGMLYAFQGEQDAKMLLFQCLDADAPPPETLFAACALGLLHNDLQLAELTLKELRAYEDDPKYGAHAAFLIVQFYVARNEMRRALVYFQKRIHLYPDRVRMRQAFAEFLLRHCRQQKRLARPAAVMAESVVYLNDPSMSDQSVIYARHMAAASEALRRVDRHRQRILAQKAVHLNPTVKEAWTSLIIATR